MQAGFALNGQNGEGIFTLWPYLDPLVVRHMHSGDPSVDPWCWRIRAVTEWKDLAFGKFFFGKGSWISSDWLSCFLCVRRRGASLEEWYWDGLVSNLSREIYRTIQETPGIPYHLLKARCMGDAKSSAFDTALTALQEGLFVTVCGEAPKISKSGQPYGWPSVTYCTMEYFFGEAPIIEAASLSPDEAEDRIRAQLYRLNPAAVETAIRRFIRRKS